MAKSLRNKMANMALCCTVVTTTVGQVAPIMAQTVEVGNEVVSEIKEVATESATESAIEIVDAVTQASAAVDPWEMEVAHADYLGTIQVLHETDNTDSMAAGFFTKESVPVSVVDGKATIKLKISKDGFGQTDVIQTIEQLVGGDTYENLTVSYKDDETLRYVIVEAAIEDIDEPIVLRTGIDIGSMQMAPSLRVVLSEDTKNYLKEVTAPVDPWEEAVEDADYLGTIQVRHETEDTDSMASDFFTKENVPVTVVDGKATIKLKVLKDGLGQTDVIQSIEQLLGDGTYENLTVQYKDDETFDYVMVEATILNVDEAIVLRTGLDIGSMQMSPSLRIVLSEDTKAYLKEALEEPEVEVVMPEDGEYTVDLSVLHATEDQDSKMAAYFKTEGVHVEVREGKAYLTFNVSRHDGAVQGLDVEIGGEYVPVEVKEVEIDGVAHYEGQIVLDNLAATTMMKCHIKMGSYEMSHAIRVLCKTETLQKVGADSEVKPEEKPEEKPEVEVVMPEDGQYTIDMNVLQEAEDKDSKMATYFKTKGVHVEVREGKAYLTFNVSRHDGAVQGLDVEIGGAYVPVEVKEVEIGGVAHYQGQIVLDNLAATTMMKCHIKFGSYNMSHDIRVVLKEDTLKEVVQEEVAPEEGLADGYYSVNIDVLHETQDKDSMAADFFNKEALPLRIVNGKAYLTIQVYKDNLGMTDVIESLEQRIDGAYKSLRLNYKDDASKRYITAEVQFDDISQPAYLKCGVTALNGYQPVLRIKLDENSIQEGAGSIDTTERVAISKVEAENGKVTVRLTAPSDEIAAGDFLGKIYIDGDTTGKTLTLKDFTVQNEVITFTYDEIVATEKDQSVVVGITYEDAETKSSAFTVKGLLSETVAHKPITIKENAKEIKYIKGYEDGTFKPNAKVSKAEALNMLSLLVNKQEAKYYTTKIDVLQAESDKTSMAAQFFKTENIKVKQVNGRYLVELEIENEGLGFSDIITGIEQKIGETYKAVEVRKSSDMKKAYVTLEVASLDQDIVLRTGIAPMGSVAPELRIVVDEKALGESSFESNFTDADMWAKDAIATFEEAGIIGENGETTFAPESNMTRGEFIKIVTQVAGLEIPEEYTHDFKDLSGHTYEAYIVAAIQAGYIKGYGDHTFKPEGTLTRAEAVTIINRLIGHTEETNVDVENPFGDLKTNHWAYDEILKVTEF